MNLLHSLLIERYEEICRGIDNLTEWEFALRHINDPRFELLLLDTCNTMKKLEKEKELIWALIQAT